MVFEARMNDYSPTIAKFLESFGGSFTPWEWERISNVRRRPPSSDRRERRAGAGRSEDSRLREFFLRWSMKEAYTKALGLGMHVDFDGVEIRLYGTDLDADPDEEGAERPDEEEGIWTTIERHMVASSADRQGGHVADGRRTLYYSAIGKVKRLESATSPWDVWEFIFVPLLSDDDDDDDDDNGGGGGDENRGLVRGAAERDKRAGAGRPAACACICRGPLPRNASSGSAERCRATLEPLTLTDLVRMHGCGSL